MRFITTWRRRGDTLLEVMVAMVLLSSLLIATFSILNRAVDTNVNIKNRIIALNIAREGMEAVRNLRDTNWLKYSGDRRGKWLCRDSVGNPNACNGGSSTLIDNDGTGKYYTIDYDMTASRYYLAQPALDEELDLTSSAQAAADQNDYRLELDTINNRYTHTASGTSGSSIFYRQLNLQAINPYAEISGSPGLPTFCNSSADDPDCFYGRLRFEVVVHWLEEGRSRKVRLEGYLFDFFERNDYS